MRSAFADTGYWIALIHPKDEHHQRAKEISKAMEKVRIVTSEMVLTEFLNGFAKFGSEFRDLAGRLVRKLRSDSNVTVVPQSSAMFDSALALYSKMQDKAWGLTDCASIEIMRERDLTEALAHDIHFQQAGFRALLRD